MIKNVFLFHVKSSLRSQDIKLISKFRTPQTEKQTVAIHPLSNLSSSNGNQTIKLDPLIIEYNMRNISPDKSYT